MAQQSTTQLGTLEPFDGTDFADYSERLNSYFIANNIGQVAEDAQEAERRAADKRKVAVTISVIGKKTYSTLKDLCLPDLPADKTYEELTEILKGFYKPKVREVAETYRFHHTVQSENESVTEYANKLKRLAVNCNFGQYLTRALRDQFVGGVRSQSTRKKLLSEDRTFDQALKVARAHELAEKESRQFPLSEEAAKNQAVHGVNQQRAAPWHNNKQSTNKDNTEEGKCCRCGSTQHMANKCAHASSTCNYCRKTGHLAKVCFAKKNRERRGINTHQITTTNDTETSSDEETFSDRPTIYMKSVNSTEDSSSSTLPGYKLGVTINGQEVSMEIDTGSSVTLLNSKDFSRIGGVTDTLKPATVVLKSYTGNVIKCLGEKEMNVQVGEQVSDLKIRVVEGPSLLGRDMMAKFTLPWQNIFSAILFSAEDIIQRYPELFDNSTVGKLKGFQVSLRVKDNNPVFVKPRVVPCAIRKKYEEALEKLVAEDIIEKVEYSEWASPTFPVIKPNGDIRICGDYSVTINQHSNLEQYPVPTLEDLLSKLSGGTEIHKA